MTPWRSSRRTSTPTAASRRTSSCPSTRPGASTTARSPSACRWAGARRGGSNTASPGAEANPYLVMAAVLAGLHHGLANGLAPRPPPPATPERRQTPPCRSASGRRSTGSKAQTSWPIPRPPLPRRLCRHQAVRVRGLHGRRPAPRIRLVSLTAAAAPVGLPSRPPQSASPVRHPGPPSGARPGAPRSARHPLPPPAFARPGHVLPRSYPRHTWIIRASPAVSPLAAPGAALATSYQIIPTSYPDHTRVIPALSPLAAPAPAMPPNRHEPLSHPPRRHTARHRPLHGTRDAGASDRHPLPRPPWRERIALRPLARAIAAMEAAARDTWMYGDPENFDLKQALAAHHGCTPAHIVVGPGSTGSSASSAA